MPNRRPSGCTWHKISATPHCPNSGTKNAHNSFYILQSANLGSGKEQAGKARPRGGLIVFGLRFGALFKKNWSENIFLRLDIEDLKP